jgi:GDP-4-dehydro-6-deoxy-D-mannose reductase
VTVNLVTGADGFVGQHLVTELLRRGEEVVGAVLKLPPELTTLSESQSASVRWIALDLERVETIRALARQIQADRIFHLAGLSSPAASFDDPAASFKVNAAGTLLLLEELAEARSEARAEPVILISGSAHVYGAAAARYLPLTEDCPLEPLSPYAVSKAAQEFLGLQYHRSRGLSVIVTRSFNHTGPGQTPAFVAPQLAARIREIARTEGRGVVAVGAPEVRRDFTDVRDVVRAYIALTEKGEVGTVYNVCSGRSYAVGELVDMLAELAGVSVTVRTDPGKQRPVDISEMIGSYARLATATGWAPEIDIRTSLADLLGD